MNVEKAIVQEYHQNLRKRKTIWYFLFEILAIANRLGKGLGTCLDARGKKKSHPILEKEKFRRCEIKDAVRGYGEREKPKTLVRKG